MGQGESTPGGTTPGETTPERDLSVPGETAREFVVKMGQALDALAIRFTIEPAFTAELEGVKEPLLKSLKAVSETAQQRELEAIDAMGDLAVAAMETQIREFGVLPLLDAAIVLGRPNSRPTAKIAPSGFPEIPGLDIIKEIIHLLKDIFGWDNKLWGKLINGILDIMNKDTKGVKEF